MHPGRDRFGKPPGVARRVTSGAGFCGHHRGGALLHQVRLPRGAHGRREPDTPCQEDRGRWL